jgi:peptidoglycan hydrolase CwlO-like protein
MRRIILILISVTLLTACGGNSKQREAIDARWKALRLHQETELKRAQEELAQTDSLLQQVQNDYDSLQAKVEKDKAALCATPEELTMLTKTRIKRDSLRTQCETLGAKIRYIRKKQEEVK